MSHAAAEMSMRVVQAREHGVYMILDVLKVLEEAEIVCCMTGVKALRYYGAARVSDVSSCHAPGHVSHMSDSGSGLAGLRTRQQIRRG